MATMTREAAPPPDNDFVVLWDPGDVDMDTGTIPIPPSFSLTIDDVGVTIDSIEWLAPNLLRFNTSNVAPSGAAHLIYQTTDNNLKNLDGIIALQVQQKKAVW